VGLPLLQQATMYKDDNKFHSKEFVFKIQSAKGKSSEEDRKTIGKLRVDLSQFCGSDVEGQPQEVFLQLKCAPARCPPISAVNHARTQRSTSAYLQPATILTSCGSE
jgi:hypothetical protein